VAARAEIKGQTVVVSSPLVPNPVAVRYGWSDENHEANLTNAEGLPAAPFRTDTWPPATLNATYKVTR
jgi:sialate O-acetylesterase